MKVINTTAKRKIESLTQRKRVIQGGTSASKTFSILCVLIKQACTKKTEISIVGETVPHLRRGAIRDFIKIMIAKGIFAPARWNKTLLTYQFANRSTIEFFSADQEARLRGARRQVLFINEANNIQPQFVTIFGGQALQASDFEFYQSYTEKNQTRERDAVVSQLDFEYKPSSKLTLKCGTKFRNKIGYRHISKHEWFKDYSIPGNNNPFILTDFQQEPFHTHPQGFLAPQIASDSTADARASNHQPADLNPAYSSAPPRTCSRKTCNARCTVTLIS